MSKRVLSSCAAVVSFIIPTLACAQSVSSSSSASSSQGNAVQNIGSPTPMVAGRSAAPATSNTPANGTNTNGQFVVTTQVNINGTGGIGVATSISGGFTGQTNFNNSFGGQSQSGTTVISRTMGVAINGGSFNVGSGVVSGNGGTTTSSYGGQYTTVLNIPTLP